MPLQTARTGSEGGARATQQWATGPYSTRSVLFPWFPPPYIIPYDIEKRALQIDQLLILQKETSFSSREGEYDQIDQSAHLAHGSERYDAWDRSYRMREPALEQVY